MVAFINEQMIEVVALSALDEAIWDMKDGQLDAESLANTVQEVIADNDFALNALACFYPNARAEAADWEQAGHMVERRMSELAKGLAAKIGKNFTPVGRKIEMMLEKASANV